MNFSRLRSHITYANVVASLALFLALGGVGYAAATIGSGQIKNNSVRSKDIRNKTVVGKDVKDNAMGSAQVKESALGKVPMAQAADIAARSSFATATVTSDLVAVFCALLPACRCRAPLGRRGRLIQNR